MYRSGLVWNKIIYSTLIYNLCKHGNVTQAMKVYVVMNCTGHCADHFTCNVLVSSLCRDGKLGNAENFIRHMSRIGLVPNSIAYDCIINGYSSIEDPLNAFSYFDDMIRCA